MMKSFAFSPSSFFVAFTPVIFLHFPKYSHTKIEFCLRGRHQLYSEFEPSLELDSWYLDEEYDASQPTQSETKIIGCPSGILFNRPLLLEAVTAENEPFCYKQSICDEKWKCNFQKNSIVTEIIKIGKPGRNETWVYAEGDRRIKNRREFAQCQASGLRLNKIDFIHSHRKKRDITGLVPSEPTSADQIQREVDDQTKRMFYYLSGINQDEVNSHLRVVKLFKMSSQLASMICDPQFISPKFLKEIERGFLFLLKEQGFDKMTDLDLESYNQLRQTLEHCASTVKTVKFMGSPCPTGIKIQQAYQIEDEGLNSINYQRGPKTFKWGEYDIVLDAAWSTMMIVHAGCFESFSGRVNLLHKFEVALEQLFHSALYIRWEHPTKLTDDLFYNSMFMARVNDTLEAMDSCTRFLYLLTPFRLQMNRPIHETFYRRKKRSISSESSSEEFERVARSFSSLENSIETSDSEEPTLDGYEMATSSEEFEYNQERPSLFECLKSEPERLNKVKVAQRDKYNDCSGPPKND